MSGLNKYFTIGREGDPGVGAFWPAFANHLQNTPTGYTQFYPKTDGRWYEKRGSVTKAFAFLDDVTAAANGFDVKQSCRVATTANVNLSTDLENGDTIDGVTLATGDRVLVKNQSTASQNGIYVASASGAASRATDADSSSEITAGLYTFVTEGTANADTMWVLTTNDPITLDTTGLTFAQFGASGFTSPLTTRGDLLTRDGSTHIRLAVGAVRQVLRSDGTDPLWAAPKDGDLDPGAEEYVSSDPMIGSSATTCIFPWTTVVVGAGAAVTFLREAAGHLGVVSLATGTATTGRTMLHTEITAGLFGSDEEFSCSVYFQIPTLADATDDYELWIGFLDNSGAGDPIDGACVHYDRDTSANWQRMTASNSTITQNVSGTTDGTAVAVATGWQTVTVRGNSSVINFYHRPQGGAEVFLGSESTNIPSGANRVFGFGIKIQKEAGTNDRLLNVDTAKIGQRV